MWRILTQYDRTYVYVRTVKDEKDVKKYYFQIQEKGKNLGYPKPITLVKEGSEWKVKYANP